jgi:hypothetical protein
MGCKIGLDQQFLLSNLNVSFVKKDYREHRRAVLFEEQKARIPNAQTLVQDQIKIDAIVLLNNNDNDQIKDLTQKLKNLKETVASRKNNINRIIRGEVTSAKERRDFIMPCPDENCKGFLTSGYKCGLCNKKVCSQCIIIIGDEEHECNPDMVATAAMIKRDTKPCPTCGERIMKIDGCDQMWCVKCHTTFSWNKGIIEKGNIHNPHYYNWLRTQSVDGTIPRVAGDGVVDNRNWQWSILYRMLTSLKMDENLISIIEYSRAFMIHVTSVEMRNIAPQRPNRNNTIALMTTDEGELVKFLRNQITEKQFREGLAIRDVTRKIDSDIHGIYTMYTTEIGKIILELESADLTQGMVLKSCNALIKIHLLYTEQLMSVSNICNRVVCIFAIGRSAWNGRRKFTTIASVKNHQNLMMNIKTPLDFCKLFN